MVLFCAEMNVVGKASAANECNIVTQPLLPFCTATVAWFPVLGMGSQLRKLQLTKWFRQLAMGEKTIQCEKS